MDNFEALSNNELREQLKSHNIGNFPVTDTTRNALIKKLRNALNVPTKPAKGRRETVNVVKHSSAEESAESDAELKKINKPKAVSNRRATIAATASKPVNGVVIDKVPAKVAPVRSKSPGRKSVPPPEPISYFADASDDDLVAAAEEAEKQTRRKTTRTSPSPSLTKSSVVTTSYKHTIPPLIEQNDDVILLNDNSDAEYSSDLLEKIRKPSTPTTKIFASADNRRKTLQVGPSISTNFASFKSSEKPVEDTTGLKRRYTTYASPLHDTHGLEESNEDILKKVETPFLSDFTRRLAQLKAEQLPGTEQSTTTYDYKTPKSTTLAYLNEYRSSVYGSNRVGDRFRDKSIGSLKQQQQLQKPSAWSAVEKKFRWPLVIILAIFVAVFVYVFLFSTY
ncbi:otefin [Sitodiplosis mosellana]|uniref:otefin n=1 Tax=Sitodiplosis mosellana TaxID=263140 RepID=UPI0024451F49|nr:otefin [Sitodiplosis mosellana]